MITSNDNKIQDPNEKPIEQPFEEEEGDSESQSISNIFPEIGYTRTDRIDQDMDMLSTKGILPDHIIKVLPKYYRIADNPECAPRKLDNFRIIQLNIISFL
ncbi:hypothetical protein M9Y10_013169 [Tritrichomonas musculus]|uniref:Uncharacterized protein n=1 Tax=Tritrichomonas musculus TaxID=1915356 RepID=A0ABR2I7I9_9EUKA